MAKRTTKTEQVLNHLKQKGSITSWEAITLYGATRLSAIIFNLKHRGHNITSVDLNSTDRNGNSSKYAVYLYDKQTKLKLS